MPALLQLLEYLGFERDQILFQSHYTTTSASTLIERVEFLDPPSRPVAIYLNTGLLGPNSPLPTYFRQFMEEEEERETMVRHFLSFFDHFLLSSWVDSLYGERNPHLFPSWEKTLRQYLSLRSISSAAFLHWLFQLTFPELQVTVRPCTVQPEQGKSLVPRLGEVTLGDPLSSLGKSTLQTKGLEVVLWSEEERNDQGRPWAQEVRKRFWSHLTPLLSLQKVCLQLTLTIERRQDWAKVSSDTLLGVHYIRGEQKQQPLRVSIFSGVVSSANVEETQ